MSTIDILWLAWPWIGFGAGIGILIQMSCSDHFRGNVKRPRYSDTTWLSWLMVVAYLIHVCEEYSMHIVDGKFFLVQSFIDMGINEKFGGIPLAFFPYVNIALTWITLPIAASMSTKNPVVGLSGIGFVLINGLTHLASCVVGGTDPIESPGSVTGIFVFIPLFIWVVYICMKEKLLPKKGLGIAIGSGAITHILLFSIYILNKIAGHTAAMLYVPIVAASPILLSCLLCKMFNVKFDKQINK